MQHDAWFFIGVFVFIFIIWIATGGPTRPIAFTGPTLPAPGTLVGGAFLRLPTAPFTLSLPGSSNTLVGGRSSGGGDSSLYRDLVFLNHSVFGAGSSRPENEYLEIRVAQNANVPVDISGWTLESDISGSASVIPRGTEVPRSGVVNEIQDIVLTPGTRAIIVTGRSPIGASFRENKCIGYFSNYQTFFPSLPLNCPTPASELASSYGAGYFRDLACIDYVGTIGRCQVVLTPPVNVSGTCQSAAVGRLNYSGCLAGHEDDADFKGDTWRVYLGRTSPLWRRQYEIVRLLDTEGKTVDAFSY